MDNYVTARLGPLQFSRPRLWSEEIVESNEGVAVTLQSPNVSFAIVGAYPDDQEPAELIEQALDSLRDEHPNLEVEEVDELGDDAIEAVFMTLDTVAYCWMRSWRVADYAVLVMLQSVDREAKEGKQAFRRICKSLEASDAIGDN